MISCNSSIGELAKQLPDVFYPLHRSYLVNTLYLLAVRRFEAELIDGITLPIPAQTYQQIKEDLESRLTGSRKNPMLPTQQDVSVSADREIRS